MTDPVGASGLSIPVLLLAVHFVADFLFQSDWMALNKSKRWDALAIHAGVYTACFFWCPQPATFLFVTFWSHFLADAVTSRITSRLWFFKREDGIWAQAEYTIPKHGRTIVNPWTPIEGTRHWFFVVIGFDQLIHFVTLALTWRYLA
jgi:hypothetical protein